MKRMLTLLLGLMILSVAGCGSHSEPPMRIGTNLWPGYEPLYLAKSLNYWNEGEVELREYPSASEVIRAFKNHSLDAAALTLDEALTLRQIGIPVQVALVLDISHGADVIVAAKEISSFSELKGKRVAIESGALGAYVVSRALALNNMTLSDIKVVHLDVSEHERAFAGDKVDAAVTFEPVKTKLLELGGNVVFSSKEIPGEIVDVLIVHQDYLDKVPGNSGKMADGWFKAIEYMRTDEFDAAALIADRMKITPAEVLDSYTGLQLGDIELNRSMLNSGSGTLPATFRKLSEVMLNNNLLNKAPSLNNITSDRLIQ